jgi:cyclohexyl-isocyanide hydratase
LTETSETAGASAGSGARPQVGMLLYPGLTLLDLIGPQTTLSGAMDVHLLWKTRDQPVVTDTTISVFPTMTFAECPAHLDVLFVPGGPGMVEVMRDRQVLDFLADRGASATWVTSVCSGSIILGAAGLLTGYRATSHWGALDMLRLVGAEPVAERVVTDRNRVTAGGVTAGIDFGLTLVASMFGEDTAKAIQLGMEYDPQPPFDAGTPSRPDASDELVTRLRGAFEQVDAESVAALHALGFGLTTTPSPSPDR